MRRTLALLVTVCLLSACATGGVPVPYDPYRCDRNGDENQRRAC